MEEEQVLRPFTDKITRAQRGGVNPTRAHNSIRKGTEKRAESFTRNWPQPTASQREEKRARGTEGWWFPVHVGITGQKGNGIQGIRKGVRGIVNIPPTPRHSWTAQHPVGEDDILVRGSYMGEHEIWGSTWGKTKNRSSKNGRFIKWGRIVKREKAGDGNKWDRIFKRDPEAESEEVLKMVAKRAKKERKTTTQICTVVTKHQTV